MTTNEETAVAPSQLVAMRETHREICRALNIDADTERNSWLSYERTRDQFDLTGEAKHWICCALYVACLQDLPAVGHPDHYIQGNGVNITNLLTNCNINIQEFFDKMKQWAEIRSLPERLQKVVNNLQHEFSVSITTYTKYNEDFPRLFNEANLTQDEPKRNKKSKPTPCSYKKLHEFAWLLFLNVKEQHKDQRHDLATAMDLCVCVLDLIYRNVVTEGRMDLINPSVLDDEGSSGTPSVDDKEAAVEAALKLNLWEMVGNDYPTTSESVTETSRTIFLPTLAAMFEAKDLRGTRTTASGSGGDDTPQFSGLISLGNFDENLKSLNRSYERSILRCGMLDERIALNSRMSPSCLRQRWSVNITRNHPRTPLSMKSSRGRVGGWCSAADFSAAGAGEFVVRGTLSQLMNKIQDHEPGNPRGTFQILMRNCTPSPLSIVLQNVRRMRTMFIKNLTEREGWKPQTADSRFDPIEALYYQLLENIIPWELKKRPSMTVSKVIYEMCSNEFFNETVMVCAAEILLFLRNDQHTFPWILDIFGMHAFRFFNIIEVTVSANSDILTSDIVNHLRRIEEQLVDSLCWKSTSVMWECMEKENYQIPANKDVEQRAEIAGVTPLKGDSIPNQTNGTRAACMTTGGAGSSAGTSSTVPTTATGRPAPHPDSAKKKLFLDSPTTPSKQLTTPASSTSAVGSSSTAPRAATTGTSDMALGPVHSTNGCNETPSISSFSSPQRDNNDPPSADTRRLNFFFRKMYHVAYDRLNTFCQDLGIDNDVIQKLIWTIFEFTITKCSKNLMRDRHLDQLLMCAIFVTMRIRRLPNTFKQIMHCYNNQPQANSSIYRSVFIRHDSTTPPVEEQQQQHQSAVVGDEEPSSRANGEQTDRGVRVPVTEMVGSSVQYDREVYGDIIRFYNDIYVVIVHSFALQYINADVSHDTLFLSPTPKTQVRTIHKSPRQISSSINLYVSTTNKICSLLDSPNVRTLTFPASPGQSPTIHERNVAPVNLRGKRGDTCARSLTEATAFVPNTASKMRRLDKIHLERRHQDQESSENEDRMDNQK